MPKPWKIFINGLRNFVKAFAILLMGSNSSFGANGVMPIDNTEIKLPDGRTVEAVRCGVHCQCLNIKMEKRTLRRQCYQEEFDRLWDYAFFVPMKPGQYVADVDGDGSPEIGVATWDGGNNIANRYALVFSIKRNKLNFFGRRKFNLEYGEYLYE
jgi:hypothetical protein